MPYIDCDGTTYSRYNTSQKVKDCIQHEKDMREKSYVECRADPVCAEQMDSKEVVFAAGVVVIGVLIVLLIGMAIFVSRPLDN